MTTTDWRPHARPGRGGWNDEHYARVAAEYVTALDESPKAPLVALAERLEVSHGQARNMVLVARQRGLLSEARQGQKGGTLTDRGTQLVADWEARLLGATFAHG